MWFVLAFALFTFMGTKFHHYILPAVPPAAMLLGIVLSDLLGEEHRSLRTRRAARPLEPLVAGVAALAVAAVLGRSVLGVAKACPGSILGDRLPGDAAAPSYGLSAALCFVAVALFVRVGVAAAAPKTAEGADRWPRETARTRSSCSRRLRWPERCSCRDHRP